MPKILSVKGFEFFFYSNEGNEPRHIHVVKAEATGKVWLEPQIRVSYMYGFTNAEKKEILVIVMNNLEYFKSSWNEHFNQ